MAVRTSHQANKLSVRSEEDGGKKFIEGYFVVFNEETELFPGYFEKIAPGAFEVEGRDIRCLYNHNWDIVLGRQGVGTLEVRTDEKGIWGRVEINADDPQAMAAYARIRRGDIYGCSFGFDLDINGEKIVTNTDGTMHSTITKGTIYEISPCVFPAYEQTEINARCKKAKEQVRNSRKAELSKRLAGLKIKKEV